MLTRLAAGTGALLALTIAPGVASADPDMSPVIDTTCSYPQVVSALDARDPAAAAQFNASPIAQNWLTSFLGAPPDERRQMVTDAQASPMGQPFVGAMLEVANTCSTY